MIPLFFQACSNEDVISSANDTLGDEKICSTGLDLVNRDLSTTAQSHNLVNRAVANGAQVVIQDKSDELWLDNRDFRQQIWPP